MAMSALERVIDQAGTAKAVAAKIGVKPMAVTQWRRRGVPAERVLDLVRIANGAVSPHELRPDIYPDPEWMPGVVEVAT